MHNNEKTIMAIKAKCQEVLLEWEIIDRSEDPVSVTVLNSESKVSVTSKLDAENGVVYSMIYKITDQTALMRPKRATVVFYNDGDFHCEYSAFKSEEDILESLNK